MTLNIRKLISPNFNDRAGGAAPGILVLHYTGTQTAKEAEDYYMNIKTHAQSGPVSPHYMIDRDGAVTQFVEEDKRAWHAGQSWWDGRTDLNSHSIGIELVNPGHDWGYIPFTQPQMDALSELTREILSRHTIAAHCVLGHSDIAPLTARKKPDPGEYFDWAWMAAQGVGLWPAPQQSDYDFGDILLSDLANFRQALTEYGYDPQVTQDEAVRAFQRHFQPEAFQARTAGTPDRETAARLHWLLKAKNSP